MLVLYPESSWREARWESAQVPLAPRGRGPAAHGGRHHLDRPPDQRADPPAGAPGRPHRRGRLPRACARPAPVDDEVHDLARSINRMCAQLRQMSQTIRQSERTQLLAQLAAGTGPPASERPDGRTDEPATPLKRCEAAQDRPEHDRGPAPARVDRGAGPGPADAGQGGGAAPLRRRIWPGSSTTSRPASADLRARPGRARGSAQCAGSEPCLADEPSLRAAVLNLALNAIEAAGPGGIGEARSAAGRRTSGSSRSATRARARRRRLRRRSSTPS